MSRIIAQMSMSLDGYVADPSGSVGRLFDWFGSGRVETIWPGMGLISRTTAASADHLASTIAEAGALVVGRRVFDFARGWGGQHPLNVPVFVLTHGPLPQDWIAAHPGAPFAFVLDGFESAISQARAVAGARTIGLNGPNIAQQALNAGLLDALHIDLVPVLLGRGIRFFDEADRREPVLLENPTVIEGDRVTHLIYKIRR
jgi:dihydrofolate reductase